MTESIDVSNKSTEYIPFYQSKSPSPELKVAEKNSKKPDGKNIVAKDQIEKYNKNSSSDTTKASEDNSSSHLDKTDKDVASNITYGSKKDFTEIKIGKQKQEQPLIAYGSGDSEDFNMHLLGDPNYSIINSYGALAAAVGANSRGVTKTDLINYLQKISSEATDKANNAEVIAFVKNLIAQFDTLSGGDEYLTSITGVKEPQDYSTVTKEQVTSPVDLRV